VAEEIKFREMGWDTLRDALRRFADEGDVQMCSMLAVVAPQELKVEKRRVARFLESYVGSFCCSELFFTALDLTFFRYPHTSPVVHISCVCSEIFGDRRRPCDYQSQ
jgi:hypothetical protein